MSMTKISEVIVGAAGAASIDFNNIPSGFTDLKIVFSFRGTVSAGVSNVKLTFNGSTTGYSGRTLMGFGTGAGYSETNVDQFSTPWPFINFYAHVGSTSTASTFSNGSILIPNYTGSLNKTVSVDWVNENNATGAWSGINAALWSNAAAITSISLGAYTGTWVEGSSAYLYGVKRTQAIGVPKAIGGAISYANNRWFHTFTSSGTFIANQDLATDCLVVGGGGAGGAYDGGGGGAGGYQTVSFAINKNASTPVAVGAGGAGGVYYRRGQTGTSSALMSTVSIGGGGGGSAEAGQGGQENGGPGASGGGARGGRGGGNSAGSGTAGQGNNGGSSAGSSGYGAGGGGGAGQAGGTGSTGANGNGGDGLRWIDGNYYAGGGGGCVTNAYGIGTPGAGGLGGGAAGAVGVSNGTANTGGGGGANRDSTPGGAGGSGVVIISYLAN